MITPSFGHIYNFLCIQIVFSYQLLKLKRNGFVFSTGVFLFCLFFRCFSLLISSFHLPLLFSPIALFPLSSIGSTLHILHIQYCISHLYIFHGSYTQHFHRFVHFLQPYPNPTPHTAQPSHYISFTQNTSFGSLISLTSLILHLTLSTLTNTIQKTSFDSLKNKNPHLQ